jgi:hypothetical protein
MNMGFFHAFTQLTAAGVTTALNVGDLTEHVLQYKVAAINDNVVLRMEGSVDGTNFFNLSSENVDVTVVANETNAFVYSGKVNYIRGRFVSETGGTDATVDFSYTGR